MFNGTKHLLCLQQMRQATQRITSHMNRLGQSLVPHRAFRSAEQNGEHLDRDVGTEDHTTRVTRRMDHAHSCGCPVVQRRGKVLRSFWPAKWKSTQGPLTCVEALKTSRLTRPWTLKEIKMKKSGPTPRNIMSDLHWKLPTAPMFCHTLER